MKYGYVIRTAPEIGMFPVRIGAYSEEFHFTWEEAKEICVNYYKGLLNRAEAMEEDNINEKIDYAEFMVDSLLHDNRNIVKLDG